jgi:hypothetical protein
MSSKGSSAAENTLLPAPADAEKKLGADVTKTVMTDLDEVRMLLGPSAAENTLLPAPADAEKKIGADVKQMVMTDLDEVRMLFSAFRDESGGKLVEATNQILRPSSTLAEIAASISLADLADPVDVRTILDAIRALEVKIEAAKAGLDGQYENKPIFCHDPTLKASRSRAEI